MKLGQGTFGFSDFTLFTSNINWQLTHNSIILGHFLRHEHHWYRNLQRWWYIFTPNHFAPCVEAISKLLRYKTKSSKAYNLRLASYIVRVHILFEQFDFRPSGLVQQTDPNLVILEGSQRYLCKIPASPSTD
jgi:hypothetical protein